MSRRAWLTPDALPATLRECVLRFPDSEEWTAIVRGCLFLLSEERNFEEFGSLSVAQVADTFRQTLFDFNQGDCMLLPIGSIVPFAGVSPGGNWLVCNGAAVSRATYSELFAICSTAYGVGDGSTTFNVPDARGRVLVGVNPSVNPFYAFGVALGSQTHTLTTGEMPAHTHGTNISSNGGSGNPPYRFSYLGNGVVSGDVPTTSVGGGGSHNNIQPSLTVNYIIRAL